jgi:hypothetical protein
LTQWIDAQLRSNTLFFHDQVRSIGAVQASNSNSRYTICQRAASAPKVLVSPRVTNLIRPKGLLRDSGPSSRRSRAS